LKAGSSKAAFSINGVLLNCLQRVFVDTVVSVVLS